MQRTSRAPEFHTSMSVRLRRISRSLCLLHAPTLAARVQSSIPPSLCALQRTSRAPELLRQTPPRLHTGSAPPDIYTSTSTHLQRTSRAPELHTSTLHVCSACSPPPYLHTSSLLHLQPASRAHTKEEGAYKTFRSSRHTATMCRKRGESSPTALTRQSLPLPKLTTVPISSRACYYLQSLLSFPKLAADSRACYRLQSLLRLDLSLHDP